LWALLATYALGSRKEPTVEELKARVATVGVADRPALCIHISERQLDAAGRFYAAGDDQKAQTALADVVEYSQSAGEYAIQSRKHEKQSEIAIRKMVRKLDDLRHTVTHDEQEQIQHAIESLQRVRDDLLAAMFPKAGKQ
jgi:enoyl-[acyl-carrier-protein] reductase (NADH)